jgi:hypothetical protein
MALQKVIDRNIGALHLELYTCVQESIKVHEKNFILDWVGNFHSI